jgi:serine/threonine-protein kinase
MSQKEGSKMSASRIGHYTIVSELGRGGMGVVYKAHEESLNRFVAIKVLGEHLSEDPTFVARFVREAQAAAALSHPNIIQIFFIGEDNGRHYFVMEYVSGKSLLAMVRAEGKIANPRAAQYMLQAANGLAAAHDKGFVHRDIKPANLMVDDRGLLKIADFGLALPHDATTKLTATGMLMGTPGYLSPEQCRGEGVDRRTDIYSLGVTYYELLSGRMPFQADSPLALLHKILQEEPPDITSLSASVDPEAHRIVNRMIAKDREKRYQDCHELAGDLETFLAAAGSRGVIAGLAGMRPAATVDESEQPTSLLSDSAKAPIASPPADVQSAQSAPGSAVSAPILATSATAPMVAPSSAPATAPAQIAPASALVPAPQAAPVAVAAPQARKSRAPFVALGLIALLLVAMGVSAFLAFRSPLVRRYIPWLGAARTAQESEAASTSTTSEAPSGQNPAQQPQEKPAEGEPATTGESSSAASGAAAGGLGATSGRETVAGGAVTLGETSRPQMGAGRQGTSRATGAESAAATSGRASGVTRQHSEASQGSGTDQAAALSGVAVAVVGEEPLAGTVASLVQSELSAAGMQALDAATLPGSEDLLRGQGEPSATELVRSLRGSGAAVLVLAKVQRVGERMLSYMGRQDIAYSSRVTLTSYDLATGRQKGQSRSAMVEYTQLSLEQASQKALAPLARQLAEEVR